MARSPETNALVVLGGGVSPDGQINDRVKFRIQTAGEAWAKAGEPAVVFSGKRSFIPEALNRPFVKSEAAAMRDFATISTPISSGDIQLEERSLDTIGNAYFTKLLMLDPALDNNWERITLVTSESHLERSMEIFSHVMGPGIRIEGEAAPEEESRLQFLRDMLAVSMMKTVFEGTKPGDHVTIKNRLDECIPGYGEVSLKKFAANLLGQQIKNLRPDPLTRGNVFN